MNWKIASVFIVFFSSEYANDDLKAEGEKEMQKLTWTSKKQEVECHDVNPAFIPVYNWRKKGLAFPF